jgi:hypothetical protein
MMTSPFQFVFLLPQDDAMGTWNYLSDGHLKMMLGALLRTFRKSGGG